MYSGIWDLGELHEVLLSYLIVLCDLNSCDLFALYVAFLFSIGIWFVTNSCCPFSSIPLWWQFLGCNFLCFMMIWIHVQVVFIFLHGVVVSPFISRGVDTEFLRTHFAQQYRLCNLLYPIDSLWFFSLLHQFKINNIVCIFFITICYIGTWNNVGGIDC